MIIIDIYQIKMKSHVLFNIPLRLESELFYTQASSKTVNGNM